MRNTLFGVFGVTAFLFTLSFSVASAETTNTADIITRMQAITVQMEALQAEFKALTAELTKKPAGAVLGAQTSNPPAASLTPVFTLPLTYGATNDDIMRIQKLLATDPEIYSHPHVTGFFGPATKDAIARLQTRFGYDPVGIIGPATTALLESYFRAYPSENFPAGVLSTKPAGLVAGASTNTSSSELVARVQAQLAELLKQTGGANSPAKPTEPSTSRPSSSATLPDFIEVRVIARNETEVNVEYRDGKEKSFALKSDNREDLVELIAEELDLDEADVTRSIRFYYGKINRIEAEIVGRKTEVSMRFASGVRSTFTLNEDDEDDVIEAIAKLFSLKERDVKNVIEFD